MCGPVRWTTRRWRRCRRRGEVARPIDPFDRHPVLDRDLCESPEQSQRLAVPRRRPGSSWKGFPVSCQCPQLGPAFAGVRIEGFRRGLDVIRRDVSCRRRKKSRPRRNARRRTERRPGAGRDIPAGRARVEFGSSEGERHPSEGWGLCRLLLRAAIGRSQPSPGGRGWIEPGPRAATAFAGATLERTTLAAVQPTWRWFASAALDPKAVAGPYRRTPISHTFGLPVGCGFPSSRRARRMRTGSRIICPFIASDPPPVALARMRLTVSMPPTIRPNAA